MGSFKKIRVLVIDDSAVVRQTLSGIMTGTRGMRELHDSGAFTIAQDAENCAVYGNAQGGCFVGRSVKSHAISKDCRTGGQDVRASSYYMIRIR